MADVQVHLLDGHQLTVDENDRLADSSIQSLNGVTAGTVTASKYVKADANKDVSGLRNVTATGSFIIGSADMNETDLEKLDGITNGTVAASKAVVVDANKDVSAFRNVTVTNLDAGASGTAGTVDVFPSTASKGKLAITCTDQTGDTTVSVVVGEMAAARTVTLRDPGAAASILTTTDATAAATTATAAEITRACDVSTRIVNLAVDTAITELAHDGKTIVMGGAGSARTFTLPAATGTGARFRFVVGAVNTSNYLIKSVAGSDVMAGSVIMVADGGDTVEAFEATATDDTITLNGTTTGGASIGDWVELQDIATDQWAVHGWLTGTGDEVTPFSDTVA